eukprot:631268-Rhodomonas_salina.1
MNRHFLVRLPLPGQSSFYTSDTKRHCRRAMPRACRSTASTCQCPGSCSGKMATPRPVRFAQCAE